MDVQFRPESETLYRQRILPAFLKHALVILVSFASFGLDAMAQESDASSIDQESEAPLEPYIAYVATEAAYARSGPGDDHYRTDPLNRGQELEVYVETPDGWLGIRPPQKSFCWVPAKATSWDGSGTAVIENDETVAWIGTRLGRARRYRWQVQLTRGEEVTVIGNADHETENGSETWLRIVPPSGEFRWVRIEDVVDSAEELVRIAQRDAPDELVPASEKSESAVATVASSSGTDSEGSVKSASLESTIDSLRESDSDALSTAKSTRRGRPTDTLQPTPAVPALKPAPSSMASSRTRTEPADKAVQIHRDVDVNDYQDRGAVIGSGLREDWREDEDGSVSILANPDVVALPASGAAVAAQAIVEPFRKVTDVVANFISPPRLIEIDGSQNQFAANTAADRRWMVGSTRDYGGIQSAAGLPSRSVSAGTLGTPTVPASAIAQTSYVAPPAKQPPRIVPLASISRVENEVGNTDAMGLSQVLSRLMSEGASADEVDPLLRRAQQLLAAGDVTQTQRVRDLLDRANRYRDIAVRRDGPTRIATTGTLATIANDQQAAAVSIQNQSPAIMPLDNIPAPLPSSTTAMPLVASAASTQGTAVGTLVQVYSTRTDSPPYALTDDSGLTVAYVTPYPGVNLTNHLNSRVAVRGNEKLLQGMATPHILADEVVRR